MSDDEWRDERRMLERVLSVLGTANANTHRAASAAALAMPHATLRAMADATIACYDAAVASAQPASLQLSLPPFATARVRDALGYLAWTPPTIAPPVPARAPRGFGAQIARAAVDIRHKWPGRVLYRLAPAALVERLKKHLG